MKYALVTGGSRGIGRAISIKLAEMGYSILINYKTNETEALKTADLIAEKGTQAELLAFDVSNKTEVDLVLGGWIEKNGDKTIEVLVNNAGIRQDVLLMWMSNEQWQDVIGSSLNGFFYVSRLVISGMLTKKYGRIVNIVSLSGLNDIDHGNSGHR